MEKAPLYFGDFMPQPKSISQGDTWTQALAAFEQKEFLKSLDLTLEYIKPQNEKIFFSTGGVEKVLQHGSIKLKLKISDGKFSITAPFLKIKSPVSIAMLRRITEINFTELTLSQVVLQNDILNIYFEEQIDLIEPYKTYDILREVAFSADFYDDVFVEKFKAESIESAEKRPFSSERVDLAYKNFQTIIADAVAYREYTESKRWVQFYPDIYWIAFLRLGSLHAEGYLKSEIGRCISDLRVKDSRENMVRKAEKNLDTLSKIPFEKAKESFYESDHFMASTRRLGMDRIESYFAEYIKVFDNDRAQQNYMGATFGMLICYYNLLRSYSLPIQVDLLVRQALMQASGLRWKEASDVFQMNLNLIRTTVALGDQAPAPVATSGANNVKSMVSQFMNLLNK